MLSPSIILISPAYDGSYKFTSNDQCISRTTPIIECRSKSVSKWVSGEKTGNTAVAWA
jgi:hypothetical protein